VEKKKYPDIESTVLFLDDVKEKGGGGGSQTKFNNPSGKEEEGRISMGAACFARNKSSSTRIGKGEKTPLLPHKRET